MTSSRVRRGQVQAHGALLAIAEHDLAIAIASANTREVLGVDAQQLLTASIATALAAPSEKQLRELPEELADVNPIAARTHDGRALDAVLHRACGMLIIELEPTGQAVRTGRINRAIDRLQRTGDLARAVLDELHDLLGFERIALYRAPDELVCSRGDAPAYVEVAPGEVQFVADRAAAPVELLAAVPLRAGAEEVTEIVLATVDAPGTGAQLAIAIGDRGCVVCEHPVAHHVAYTARAAAQVIARMAGCLLGMHDGKRTAGGALTATRVLVVDDDADQAEMLAMLLEVEGAVTAIAPSAAAAMAAIQRFQPDVLVSDISLPDKDGYTFMRELRALGPDGGGWIPAIAVSASPGSTPSWAAGSSRAACT